MRIIKATYGGVDCTSKIAKIAQSGMVVVPVNNDIVGDPTPGIRKKLIVEYEFSGGSPIVAEFWEGEIARIVLASHNRLGIFYSNNNNNKIRNAILASMDSIKKSAEGKADIITCMWEDEPNNPFIQLRSWFKASSHLNQLLQIMQLLYTARASHKYDYVSFLEHDVLYPDGYFDFPDFPSGTVICNMNYAGVNVKGWQPRMHDHQPFHQMTMRFDDAIKHCEAILSNALITNSGMIEPQQMSRGAWVCKNPAVHINHGYHFTSHYSIYGEASSKKDDYWGDHNNYLYLFADNH